MPNKNYQRGRRLEWQVKKDMEAEGWHVTRASGSHSAYDLIAVLEQQGSLWIRFIQCKTTKKLTAAKVKSLMDDLLDDSPVRRERSGEDSIGKAIFIEVVLVIKEHGKSEYTVNSLGA